MSPQDNISIPGAFQPRVIVKFRNDVELPYEDGLEAFLDDLAQDAWLATRQEFRR